MNKIWRVLAAVGSLVYAASFFLPPKFHNAPHTLFHNVWETIPGLETTGLRLAYIGVLITFCFSYVSALTSFVTLLLGHRGDTWGRRILLACHVAGGVAITGLGITLIAIDDPFPGPGVRWYAAIAPTILVGGMAILAWIMSVPKRWPVLLIVANGMQVPLQFVLMTLVIRYHGDSWGYLMGGVGALLAVVGAVMGLVKSQEDGFDGANPSIPIQV